MGIFCDWLKFGSAIALDCRTGQNKGRYCKKELLLLRVSLWQKPLWGSNSLNGVLPWDKNYSCHYEQDYTCFYSLWLNKKQEIKQKHILWYMSLLQTTLSQSEFIMIPQGNFLFIHSNINWVIQFKISFMEMNISMG